ncbi:MAG: chorismate-binding protein [Spirochaetes bacterium]|nr:chorismate-binding protein [Spirochaetota bacterium]
MKITPLYKEIYSDQETPVSGFLKLTDNNSKPGFLLESKEKVEHIGRYSLMGVFSDKRFEFSEEPFTELKKVLNSITFDQGDLSLPFSGGLIGYFSYDSIQYIENLSLKNPDTLKLPETLFILPEIYLVFDHFLNKGYLFTLINDSGKDTDLSYSKETGTSILNYYDKKFNNTISTDELKPLPLKKDLKLYSNFSKQDFMEIVKKGKEYIINGDIFQTVLSQRIKIPTENSGFNIYRNLRTINPSPYMFYFNFKEYELIGSSPEILVKKTGSKAILKPIAGTRIRGVKKDDELGRELLSDEKELAEHTMLVDLARNDLNRVVDHSTLEVTQLYGIEKYSAVLHIVSEVVGRLKPTFDSVDLFRATFPAGTVTGAPKIRAMEIIEELENIKRSIYSGGIGYFSFNGDMDFCIAIRTIIKKGNTVYIQAGAGIVADSIPEKEYEETLNKAKALIQATHFKEVKK